MDKRQSDIIKIAKGLCILIVVFGHTMIPSIRNERSSIYTLWKIIYLFHMPVFFAVSGILYELNRDRYKREPIQFLKNKFRLLIIPYITISIVVYIILMTLDRLPRISLIVSRYVHNITSVKQIAIEIATYENHVAQHLWFILVLFLIFCVNIVFGKVNQKWLCVFSVITPIFILPVLKMSFELPYIIDYFLFELPFFMIGRLMVSNKHILKKVIKFNYSPIFFAVLVWIYINYVNEINILFAPVRWIFLFIIRIVGIMMIFSISALIERIDKIKDLLLKLEGKSYQIYLLHQPFIVSGGAGFLYAMDIPILVIILVITVLGIVIPLIIDKLFRNLKLYNILVIGGRI